MKGFHEEAIWQFPLSKKSVTSMHWSGSFYTKTNEKLMNFYNEIKLLLYYETNTK